MKKEDGFIVTPDSFTQEQWCEMYIKVVECAQELKIEIDRLNNIINDFEEDLEREINIPEENTGLEHNTYIDIKSTLEKVLKNFKELKEGNK